MADINIYLNEALNALTGGDAVQLPPPSWNIEKYLAAILAKINGEDYEDIPAPSWIIEQRLLAILDALDRQQNTSPIWKGLNPVVVDSHEETVKLSETNFSSWEPSTARSAIYAEKVAFTADIDLDKYDYIAETEFLLDLKYTDGDAIKGNRLYRNAVCCNALLMRLYQGNKWGTAAMNFSAVADYPGVFGIVARTTSAAAMRYNPYINVGPAYPNVLNVALASAENAQTTITVKQPEIDASTQSTWYPSSLKSLTDADNSTFTIKTTLYRFKRSSSLLGAMIKSLSDALTKDAPWSEA